jgi:putative protein kinase ArgK-like GTPase of G3E family
VAVGARTEEILGIEELVENIFAHQAHLRDSKIMEEVQMKRIEQELSLIFKDQVEKLVFAGLKGTGKKRDYINTILAGGNDPYSVVEEVMGTYLKEAERN